MNKSASHHEFIFSFGLLRADIPKKCANRRSRETKFSKFWNFTTLPDITKSLEPERWRMSYKLVKLQISPEGPLKRKMNNILRTAILYFLFAAARRQSQKVYQRTQGRCQIAQILEFRNLAKIRLSFGTDTLDINFDH